MSKNRGTSNEIRRLLRRLFRTVRRLIQEGVSENLILAVVFFALSRTNGDTLVGLDNGDFEDDGSGS